VPASVRESEPAAAPPTATNETPDVAGMSARQALALFARLGIAARLQGTGFVTSQDPAPGTPVKPGHVQTLFLSQAAPPTSRPARAREETASLPFP
jgi:beta-lactam-binding protein with PASTA domain